MAITKLTDIVNPQVMGDMLEAKIPAMLKFTPFAAVDTTLQGVAGDTKTVPSWAFVGAAADVNEGVAVTPDKMTASTKTFKIKKAMKSISITQEAVNSGLGDPVGQAEAQLGKAIAVKLDADVLTAALTSNNIVDKSTSKINYANIVDGVGAFDEEEITEKVMFVNPSQITDLRKDADFISADKYNNAVIMTGEIGMIAGTRIVPSKQIVDASGVYQCPIVKLEAASPDTEYTSAELPALTIFLKQDTTVDTEWFPKSQSMDITAAKYYGVALTNESKVVLLKLKK